MSSIQRIQRLLSLSQDGDEDAVIELCREYYRTGVVSLDRVWIATITDELGTEMWAAATEEIAFDRLHEEIVRLTDLYGEDGLPPGANEATSEYFLRHEDENWNVFPLDIRFTRA